MAGDRVGAHSPALQQPVQGDFEREERGLGELGPVQLGRVRARHHHAQGRVQMRVEPVADGVQGRGEGGEGRVQLVRHARSLAALPGEEEGEAFPCPVLAPDQPRGRLAAGQGRESADEAVAVVGQDHRPAVEGRAGDGQGVPEIRRGQAGIVAQPVQESRRLAPESFLGAGGHQERNEGELGGGARGGLVGGCLFEDQVRVGPAEPEGRDARTPEPSRVGPGCGPGQQGHRAARPVDVGGGSVDVQGPGQNPVPECEDGLDGADGTGGGLGVPEVRLDGAEEQGPVRRTVAAVGGEQGLGLYRVAEHRAGAVRLHCVHIGRGQFRVGERLGDHAALGRPAGSCQSVARTVLVDRTAAQHGQHLPAVPMGVGQTFQEDDGRSFAPACPVGSGGERLAAAIAGESSLFAELDERAWGGHHRHPARQRQRALPVTE